jgi:hypothetical protein
MGFGMMMEPSWRWIGASVIGTSHQNTNTVCQDSHLCAEIDSGEGPILVALASDGAGSASRSADGSRMICEVLLDQTNQYFRERGSVAHVNQRLVASWVNLFRDEIILQASSEGATERDFACTLIGSIVSPSTAALFQIGDGAVVYKNGTSAEYALGFWPDRGEYENSTFFATQSNFIEQLSFALIEGSVSEIALLSDGLQRLALDYQARLPHQPFFRGFFPAMRKAELANLPDLERQLGEYLGSPKINERTDDDKTLVLAIRNGSAGDREVQSV